MYTILTVANENFINFLTIFLKSLIEKSDISKIRKIFIADIGLSDESINYIKNISDKIEILNTGKCISGTEKVHTKEWLAAVCTKTEFALKLLEDKNNLPLVLIDNDTVVVEDFSSVIDMKKDMQFCKLSERTRAVRSDGFVIDYLGSFCIFNTDKSSDFLKKWIERKTERINDPNIAAPYETPALIETIKKNTDLYSIGSLSDDIVSCDNNYIENISKIIHMRSDGGMIDTENGLLNRISYLKNYDRENIYKYLREDVIYTLLENSFKKLYEQKEVIRNLNDNIHNLNHDIHNWYHSAQNKLLKINWLPMIFGISNNENTLRITILFIKITIKMTEEKINKIAWRIPIRKWRDIFRAKFN